MSIQEMKSKIHHMVDKIKGEPALKQLLEAAHDVLADQSIQSATLVDLTTPQRQRLDQAIQEHKDGKTVSNEEMKQRYRKWLKSEEHSEIHIEKKHSTTLKGLTMDNRG